MLYIFRFLLQIFFLPNVESLSITSCRLKTLPHHIGLLRSLKTLNLEGNVLTSLPHTLAFCKELRALKLYGNCLEAVPGFIIDFPNLSVLSTRVNSYGNDSPYNNGYMGNFEEACKPIEREDTPKADDAKAFQPESLRMSCAAKVSTTFDITDSMIKCLPEGVKSDILWYFKEMALCCTCRRGFQPNNQGM